MSYLLDALRKSETQRRLGEVPSLEIASAATHPAGRSRKPMLLVMALLVVAVAAFVLWREVLTPRVEPAAVEGISEPPAVARAERDLAAGSELSLEPAGETDEAPEPAEVVDEQQAQLREEARRRREAVEQARQARAQSEAAQATEQASTQPAPAVAAEDPATAQPATEAAQTQSATPAPQSPALDSSGPGQREYMRQWELPASVRSELPEMQVMAHIFSDDAENRFVLINGRRYSEGDELGQGAVLAEIRREGAIIDYKEYRFLLD